MQLLKVGDLAGSPQWRQLWERDPYQHPWYLPDQLLVAATHTPSLYYLSPDLRQAVDLNAPRRFHPLGLIAHDADGPVLGLTLSIEHIGDRVRLSAFGRPLCPIEDHQASGRRRRSAAKLVHRHLEQLRREHGAEPYHIRDLLFEGRLSMLSELVLRAGGQTRPFFSQLVNLERPTTSILAELRSSLRNLIRRNAETAEIEVVTSENVTQEHCEQLRQLHFLQYGHEFRSAAGWRALLDGVRNGSAFFLFGSVDGKCASGAYFPYSGKYCHYSIAANDPSRYGQGQSHLLLWRAIGHSRNLGCRYFEVGDRTYPAQHYYVSEKFHAISHFKAGFGGGVAVRLDVLSAPDRPGGDSS